MAEPLHLKYRPQTFSHIIGQSYNAAVLERMVELHDVPAGLLFAGPSGTGKTTVARLIAKGLDATDVIEVDAASNGGVTEIRKLLEVVKYSTGGSYRIVILDEAHSITPQGFEALLKTLEEPPPGTIFILASTEPHKVPKPVRSRLIEFQFRSVTAAAILDRLRYISAQESLDMDVKLLAHLAQLSKGNVRTAIQSLDMAVRAEVTSLAGYQRLAGEADPGPALLAALTTGDHGHIFALLESQLSTIGSPAVIQSELVATIRDLFVLKSSGQLGVTGTALESRKELARLIEQERLLFAIRTLWDLKTKLRVSDDPRGNLELAVILIAEAFTRGKAPRQPQPPQQVAEATPAPAQPAKKLSLSDLQRSR